MTTKITQLNSNEIEALDNDSYFYFELDNVKYAIQINQIVEIIKLPHLDYPQKLQNNIIGMLNYNNIMINVLDLRFYLDKTVSDYSVKNKLVVVKTEESIFAIIADSVGDIINIPAQQRGKPEAIEDSKFIDFLYHKSPGGESIYGVNLDALESLTKEETLEVKDVDIPALFPTDGESKQIFLKRSLELDTKFRDNISQNIFSPDKFMSFSLSGGKYCINISCVKEVLKNVKITQVPCTPDYLLGLITLRGNFISIIDLKKFLGLQSQGFQEENKVIIVESSEIIVGFLVDEISSIIDIPENVDEKSPNPEMRKYIAFDFELNNITYQVFDIDNILSDEKLYINDRV